MKITVSLLFLLALAITLKSDEVQVIYPNGFQTNSAPYYCVYAKQRTNGWGWAPDTNGNTLFKAVYSNDVHTTMQALGKNGDQDSMPTNYVIIPNPPASPSYRWTVYYPTLASVPHSTNDAPLTLTNFKP